MHCDRTDMPGPGEAIGIKTDFTITVSDRPVIPFVKGGSMGADVTPVVRCGADEAVSRAYGPRDLRDQMEGPVPGTTLAGTTGLGEAGIRPMEG